MLLNSQDSQFVFQFPSDFVPKYINDMYLKIFEKNWIPYENVVDYLNATIKGIDLMGLTVNTSERVEFKSKKRTYRNTDNFYDIVSTNKIDVEIKRSDSDINYMIFHHLIKHYTATNNEEYVEPFYVSVLDLNRDEIYRIVFREILVIDLPSIKLNYSQQTVSEKTFTLTFIFNYYDIEFMLDPTTKIIMNDKGEVEIINLHLYGDIK